MPMRLYLLVILLLPVSLYSLDTGRIEQQILLKVNQARKKAGLPPYQTHLKLEYLARFHSRQMSELGFFSHQDPAGRSPSQRALAIIPEIIGGIGENIAYDYGNSEAEVSQKIFQAWMKSPGHRANILSQNYHYIGIGVVQNADKFFATQSFGDLIAELLDIDHTGWQLGSSIRFHFRFLGEFPPEEITIMVEFPDNNSRFYLDNGEYYTGMGKYTPAWKNRQEFTLDVLFNHGKGSYTLKMGRTPYLYRGFTVLIR